MPFGVSLVLAWNSQVPSPELHQWFPPLRVTPGGALQHSFIGIPSTFLYPWVWSWFRLVAGWFSFPPRCLNCVVFLLFLRGVSSGWVFFFFCFRRLWYPDPLPWGIFSQGSRRVVLPSESGNLPGPSRVVDSSPHLFSGVSGFQSWSSFFPCLCSFQNCTGNFPVPPSWPKLVPSSPRQVQGNGNLFFHTPMAVFFSREKAGPCDGPTHPPFPFLLSFETRAIYILFHPQFFGESDSHPFLFFPPPTGGGCSPVFCLFSGNPFLVFSPLRTFSPPRFARLCTFPPLHIFSGPVDQLVPLVPAPPTPPPLHHGPLKYG